MITHYRAWHTGGVRIIDRPMSRRAVDWHMTYGPEHQTATLRRNGSSETVTSHTVRTVTRDGRMLRVDWLAVDGSAYVWWDDVRPVTDDGHSVLCAWPYRPCVADCPHLLEWSSHKFSAPLAERLHTLTLDSNQDDDLGDADTFGWFARFNAERAMLSVDSQGFVGVAVFESAADLASAWAGLERQELWAIVDELDTSECDELFLIIDTARHNGTPPDLDEIRAHLHAHRACWQRNAWRLEV